MCYTDQGFMPASLLTNNNEGATVIIAVCMQCIPVVLAAALQHVVLKCELFTFSLFIIVTG